MIEYVILTIILGGIAGWVVYKLKEEWIKKKLLEDIPGKMEKQGKKFTVGGKEIDLNFDREKFLKELESKKQAEREKRIKEKEKEKEKKVTTPNKVIVPKGGSGGTKG